MSCAEVELEYARTVPSAILELEIIVRYMEAGGNLLVFGDFYYSNTIAELFEIARLS